MQILSSQNRNRSGQARQSVPSQALNINNQNTGVKGPQNNRYDQFTRSQICKFQEPQINDVWNPLPIIRGSNNDFNTFERPPPLIERPTEQARRPIINNGRGLLPTPMSNVSEHQHYSHLAPFNASQNLLSSAKIIDLKHPSETNIYLPDIGSNIINSSSASNKNKSQCFEETPTSNVDERKSTEEHSSEDALPYISDVNISISYYT